MNARFLSVFLAVGCVAVGCGDGDTGTGATPSAEAAPQAGGVLFTDSLDDDRNKWGVNEIELARSSFENGGYVLEARGAPLFFAFPDALIERLDRDQVDLTNVVVKAAVDMEQAGEVAVVFCRSAPSADADGRWYEFVVRNGFAAIRISDNRERTQVLGRTDRLELPAGKAVAVQAGCVDDRDGRVALSLTVNGSPVLQVRAEQRLPEGMVGVGMYPAPGAGKDNPSAVRFLDFSVFDTIKKEGS